MQRYEGGGGPWGSTAPEPRPPQHLSIARTVNTGHFPGGDGYIQEVSIHCLQLPLSRAYSHVLTCLGVVTRLHKDRGGCVEMACLGVVTWATSICTMTVAVMTWPGQGSVRASSRAASIQEPRPCPACIPPVLHPSCKVSLRPCIPPVLHPSCPAPLL